MSIWPFHAFEACGLPVSEGGQARSVFAAVVLAGALALALAAFADPHAAGMFRHMPIAPAVIDAPASPAAPMFTPAGAPEPRTEESPVGFGWG